VILHQAGETIFVVRCGLGPSKQQEVVDGPSLNGMEQVKEILTLLDHKMIDGVCVVTNFIF
jgi:hypothetical protein